MLHRLSDLSHYTLRVIDGDFDRVINEVNDIARVKANSEELTGSISEGKLTNGVVTGFYFDQQQWRIHSIVVELGNWAASNEVLINPRDITHINAANKTIYCSLTLAQLKSSPSANENEVATQKIHIRNRSSFKYPSEWHDMDTEKDLLGRNNLNLKNADSKLVYTSKTASSKTASLKAANMSAHLKLAPAQSQFESPSDEQNHLRLCDSMIDFDVEAIDDRLGSLEEMLIDESNWEIRYFIVTTSRWWTGHQVLIAPASIKFVNWVNRIICLDLTQQQGLHSPIFEPDSLMRREKELELGLYFRRNSNSKSHQIYVEKLIA